jgi:hypothetical protein
MIDRPPLPDIQKTAATAQTDEQFLHTLSQPLWADNASIPQFYDAKPLLAHYTSINTCCCMSDGAARRALAATLRFLLPEF